MTATGRGERLAVRYWCGSGFYIDTVKLLAIKLAPSPIDSGELLRVVASGRVATGVAPPEGPDLVPPIHPIRPFGLLGHARSSENGQQVDASGLYGVV